MAGNGKSRPPPKWLPGQRVQETILTQRKTVEQLRADRVLRKPKLKDEKSRLKARTDLKRKKKLSTKKFMPAQVILQQAIKRERNAKRFNKAGEKFSTRQFVRRRENNEKVDKMYEKAKVALFIRAKGNMIPLEVKAGFKKIGLDKLYKARLVELTPQTHKTLQQLKPFGVLGYPTGEQLEQLIRTRGCFWNPETSSKSYISGNMAVEERLGEHNILTIEEMVDAVVKRQPAAAMKACLNALAPFDFHPPRRLHNERNRRTHQKLEVLNEAGFAAYLHQQLQGHNKPKTRAGSSAKKVVKKRLVKKSMKKAATAAAAATE